MCALNATVKAPDSVTDATKKQLGSHLMIHHHLNQRVSMEMMKKNMMARMMWDISN
jgi:hypothetical protein